jgi:hypothetical protein
MSIAFMYVAFGRNPIAPIPDVPAYGQAGSPGAGDRMRR